MHGSRNEINPVEHGTVHGGEYEYSRACCKFYLYRIHLNQFAAGRAIINDLSGSRGLGGSTRHCKVGGRGAFYTSEKSGVVEALDAYRIDRESRTGRSEHENEELYSVHTAYNIYRKSTDTVGSRCLAMPVSCCKKGPEKVFKDFSVRPGEVLLSSHLPNRIRAVRSLGALAG